ncbi:ABC transporter permease [Psychromonas sp. KJ10-2]|uniref:ABC transporter permease n=1 Tax=Psychromonas sp. KJ10-2 TaxID=3391822 RepID=UPI0039B51540
MAILSLAFKSLLNRKLTFFITLFSIAISVTLLLGVQTLKTETNSSFMKSISGTDLIIGSRGASSQLLLSSVFHIGNTPNTIQYNTYKKISQSPTVEWAVPISMGDSHKGYTVMATDLSFYDYFSFANKQHLKVDKGAIDDDMFAVVIGSEVAKKLNYNIGDQVIVTHGGGEIEGHHHDNIPFYISAILAPSFTAIDQTLIISLEAMEAMHTDNHGHFGALPGEQILPSDNHQEHADHDEHEHHDEATHEAHADHDEHEHHDQATHEAHADHDEHEHHDEATHEAYADHDEHEHHDQATHETHADHDAHEHHDEATHEAHADHDEHEHNDQATHEAHADHDEHEHHDQATQEAHADHDAHEHHDEAIHEEHADHDAHEHHDEATHEEHADHAEHGHDEVAHADHDDHDAHAHHGHQDTQDQRVARLLKIKPEKINAIFVGLTSPQAILSMQSYVNNYQAEPLSAIIPAVALQELWQFFSLAEVALNIVTAFVVLVGLLGMLSIILMSLNERRREMAILRSVGARPGHIFGLIIGEAGFVCFAGILLGVALLYLLLFTLQAPLASYYGFYLDINTLTSNDWFILAIIQLSALVIAFIPGWLIYKYSLSDGMSIKF